MTLEASDQDRRREFRRFVRTHHPDRGGDPAVFVAGLAAFRRGHHAAEPGPQGSYASRWPEWVAADDPRLAARTSFYRRRRGFAGALDALRHGKRRRQPRVR
jgi:hypothetical protein